MDDIRTFDGEFRRLPQSRINEIIKLARAMERGRADDDALDDKAAAAEVLAGWAGVIDDDANEVPSCPQNTARAS